jgi:hypothetical protein
MRLVCFLSVMLVVSIGFSLLLIRISFSIGAACTNFVAGLQADLNELREINDKLDVRVRNLEAQETELKAKLARAQEKHEIEKARRFKKVMECDKIQTELERCSDSMPQEPVECKARAAKGIEYYLFCVVVSIVFFYVVRMSQ